MSKIGKVNIAFFFLDTLKARVLNANYKLEVSKVHISGALWSDNMILTGMSVSRN